MTAISDAAAYSRGSLSVTPPGQAERRLAFAVMLVSLVGFVVMVPFARIHLPRVPSFIAAYEGALFICDVVTAVLIAWQMTQVRSNALLLLIAGYVFDAAMLIPHALSFPGIFSPAGLLGGRPQTTAWLYMFWHGAFPLFVIAYAISDKRDGGRRLRGGLLRPLLLAIGGALLIALLLSLLATLGEPHLPTLIVDDDYRYAIRGGISQTVWLLAVMAFISLRPWRPQSVLNLWLGVVMFAWILDVGASALVGASRFDLGFYAGRLYGLMAATFVLITLLLELRRLYDRLTAAMQAEVSARVLGQIVEAQEHERHRIARELHDEMGAYLTGMKVGLDVLAQKHGAAAVHDLQELLSQADQAVDTLAHELRPATLDDLGLDRAIAQLAERFTAATGIRVHLHDRLGGQRLQEPLETTLYRVVQEALTNVSRHSGAKTVSVILERRPEEVQLIVEDNGCGFDATRIGEPTSSSSSLGLVGMHERVRLVHGTLNIESTAGAGTSLYVRVPLAEALP